MKPCHGIYFSGKLICHFYALNRFPDIRALQKLEIASSNPSAEVAFSAGNLSALTRYQYVEKAKNLVCLIGRGIDSASRQYSPTYFLRHASKLKLFSTSTSQALNGNGYL